MSSSSRFIPFRNVYAHWAMLSRRMGAACVSVCGQWERPSDSLLTTVQHTSRRYWSGHLASVAAATDGQAAVAGNGGPSGMVGADQRRWGTSASTLLTSKRGHSMIQRSGCCVQLMTNTDNVNVLLTLYHSATARYANVRKEHKLLIEQTMFKHYQKIYPVPMSVLLTFL
jgi:hypothetical protein